MPDASHNSFPKLHNAMWPGLVGKGPDSEPPIDLDTMLDLTAAASVNGQRFEGVDLFLFDPHISIDSSDDDLKRLADKIRENEERSGNDQQNGTEDQKPGENNQQSGKQNGDQKPADDKTPEEPQPNPMSDEPGDKKPDPNEKPNENPGDRSPMPDEPSEQKPSDQKPSDQKPSDQKPSDQNPSDQKPSDQNPSDQQQSSDQQPSDQQQQTPSDQKSQNNPQQNNQQPSNQNQNQDQNQNQQQQQMENPARKQLEEAFKHMREAQQRLEEAKHKESLEEQEKAEADMLRTKALLEEILRQLREEEVGRTLELLESRFRKMLDLELRVYESTKRLDQVAEAERNRDFAIQANNLSGDQRKIALEADKALNLLEEEGSSLSFPEAVEQLRDEMYLVAERLAALKVSFVTQESEEAIIAELEELIDALQQAQQDLDQRKQQQQQQQQPSEPGEMPLVDQLAELKMIRALQMRVNTRTQRFARLLADIEDPIGQVTDAELREHIQQLSERELRIHELTRDLILGKNK
jgi:hypothetical protein